MEVDDPTQKPPAKVLAFDSTKPSEPVPVNLESPFFTIAHRPVYPAACDHRQAGVTLDIATRRAICKCGEVIDCFDALLIYAHAEQRLVSTHAAIAAHERKEAEEKAKRRFVKAVRGFEAQTTPRGRVIAYWLDLECGHRQLWDRRNPPQRATCTACFRAQQLTASGVALIDANQKA